MSLTSFTSMSMELKYPHAKMFLWWNVCAEMSNIAMGTILGKGYPQAQVQTVHRTSAETLVRSWKPFVASRGSSKPIRSDENLCRNVRLWNNLFNLSIWLTLVRSWKPFVASRGSSKSIRSRLLTTKKKYDPWGSVQLVQKWFHLFWKNLKWQQISICKCESTCHLMSEFVCLFQG